ncbi:hypothetical protein VXM97_04615 [Helicobacter pylori]|uniref:hypothetical protein n=1 Tax=Helicobacter pylori TaxID=210 RepID=UPI002F35351B
MVVRFNNNNNSEWMQMLFDKINNGSPFGIIREVIFSFSSPQLKQFLEYKCHFIGFVEIFIEPSKILFFLLVLAKYSGKIYYYENKQDKNTHNMKSIKLLNINDFGNNLDSIDVELLNPNAFVQSLLKLGSFLHGKTIESFDNPTNYLPITLPSWQTPAEIEEHRKNTTFDQNYNSLHYRQSSAQNIKINEIANAIIDKIEYHFRDNTFHFIFDIGNPLLKESSQLIIEMPREALDLENVDELVKSILLLNNNLKSHVSEGKLLPNNNLKCYISKSSYIIDLHLIDD